MGTTCLDTLYHEMPITHSLNIEQCVKLLPALPTHCTFVSRLRPHFDDCIECLILEQGIIVLENSELVFEI